MSQCNFCTLRWIRKRAERRGQLVTLLPSSFAGGGGVDVFVHSSSIDLKTVSDLAVPDSLGRSKYWKAWLMELGDHCSC